MKWTKASERLPDNMWQGKFRHISDNSLKTHNGVHELNNGRFSTGSLVIPSRNVEWLDESESSPSTVWPEEFEITEAYIKIHNGINGFALWKAAISWLKSYTAEVPEISFPDMKCTCIGEVLQKWGITPLAELVDEIEDVMCSRTAPIRNDTIKDDSDTNHEKLKEERNDYLKVLRSGLNNYPTLNQMFNEEIETVLSKYKKL